MAVRTETVEMTHKGLDVTRKFPPSSCVAMSRRGWALTAAGAKVLAEESPALAQRVKSAATASTTTSSTTNTSGGDS